MRITEYLQSKSVTPEELETHFVKFRDYEINDINKINCNKCHSLFGVERLRVGNCLAGQYCRNCNAISIVYSNSATKESARVTVYVEKPSDN